MTESTVFLVVLLLVAVAYGVYLVSAIKGDGVNVRRRQPPASHHRDMFDPTRA